MRRIIDRPPLEKGFMKGGFFAWPKAKLKCKGYTLRGVKVECGIEFENASPRAERCPSCDNAHNREWFRLNSAERRRKNGKR